MDNVSTTKQELLIENTVVKLAKLLDLEYKVKDEFYEVLCRAINDHAELIEEE